MKFLRTLAASALGATRVLIAPGGPQAHLPTEALEKRRAVLRLAIDPFFEYKLCWTGTGEKPVDEDQLWAWLAGGQRGPTPTIRGTYGIRDLLEVGYQINHEEMDAGRQFNDARPERGGRRAYR